ncbi:MAG: nitrilase [Campylobacterales bacterium]|nr:nitrilase [Campylobacterales bacterium]
MKITLVQDSFKIDKNNLLKHIDIIKKYAENSDIIIFPELSLNGYMLMDAVFEDAYNLEELNEFKYLSKDCDILVGLALKDGYKIYNSAIYFSNGSIKTIHKKNFLPNYGMFEEGRYFFSGNEFNTFLVKDSKCMIAICEDMWRAETISKISESDIDILFVIANSPTRGFNDNYLDIDEKWSSILKATAILSGCTVIFVNRVGFEDGIGFWGGSKIIDSNGKLITSFPYFDTHIKTEVISLKQNEVQKYLRRLN